ncbi:hypothetical protein [Pseudoduganella sp. RAF53_2]|uniref:hypothetical protein n=1 Tax=unclassified Pseudoduganella TaxID=2637179 RepID=UPI003F979601
MYLTILQFIAVLMAALLMGTSFCHVLEMPAKMKVEGLRWMTFQHTLYASFATVGGFIEIVAIITSGVLAFFMRDAGATFWLTLIAAVSQAMAFFGIWLPITNAVNRQTAKWTEQSLPHDWMRWRRKWEYSHAARFALQFSALCALLASLLV